jgi:hypothetical protein
VHRLSLALATVAAVGALAPFAATAASYADSVTGAEFAATSTEGTFAGVGSGSLPGAWTAVIDHTPLSPNATITGGRFSLVTVVDGSPAQIVGAFLPGGSVTLLNPSTQCGIQYFHVLGTLGYVGVGGPGTGSGSFDVTLVHYRVSIFGRCITFSATVNGGLLLQL